MSQTDIRLTQTVQKGGCAAKVAAKELRKILSSVRFPPSPKSLLIDGSYFDDAAVYQVSDELALVQTLDFFTPILDSPRLFGRVACANALSDVYAMGGTPQTAMAIFAFPLDSLSNEVAAEVLQGGCDLLAEAKVPLVGGHSIDDDTLKFGLSVTGYVHPQRIWSNQGAQSGDVLVLTKGLGTGTVTAALKRSEITEDKIREAIESMCTLNQVLDLLPEDCARAIHAATDITGFGFLGHALQMAKASKVQMSFQFSQIPALEHAFWCIDQGFLTKAHRTNREYVQDHVEFSGLSTAQELLLLDPQTSGGLLLSVKADQANSLLTHLRKRFAKAEAVGRVLETPKDQKFIRVQNAEPL